MRDFDRLVQASIWALMGKGFEIRVRTILLMLFPVFAAFVAWQYFHLMRTVAVYGQGWLQ